MPFHFISAFIGGVYIRDRPFSMCLLSMYLYFFVNTNILITVAPFISVSSGLKLSRTDETADKFLLY